MNRNLYASQAPAPDLGSQDVVSRLDRRALFLSDCHGIHPSRHSGRDDKGPSFELLLIHRDQLHLELLC